MNYAAQDGIICMQGLVVVRQARCSPRLAPEGCAQEVWNACLTPIPVLLLSVACPDQGMLGTAGGSSWDSLSIPRVEDGLITS